MPPPLNTPSPKRVKSYKQRDFREQASPSCRKSKILSDKANNRAVAKYQRSTMRSSKIERLRLESLGEFPELGEEDIRPLKASKAARDNETLMPLKAEKDMKKDKQPLKPEPLRMMRNIKQDQRAITDESLNPLKPLMDDGGLNGMIDGDDEELQHDRKVVMRKKAAQVSILNYIRTL